MKPLFFRSLIAIFLSALLLMAVAGCSGPDAKKQTFLEKGNQLFDQKEFVKARLEYKNAIQIDPEFAQAYYRLARTEMELKNFKPAYGLFLKTVELDPDNKDARLSLGKILIAARAADKAMEQADAILAKDSSHVDAGLLKASAYFLQKDRDRGEKVLLDLYKSGVTSPDMFIMLSSAAASRQDHEKVRFYLEQGLEKNPDSVPILMNLARFEAGQHNLQAVEAYLGKVIALKPEEISYKLNLARVLLMQGRKAESETMLNRALTENGMDEKVRMRIAGLWLSVKDVETAENLIKEGLKISPDSFAYRLFLAEVYVKTRRLEDAEVILRQAAGLNPDPANPEIIKANIALAKLLLMTARLTEGENLVDKVLKNDPKNIDAHFLKGKLCLSKKDGVNAVSEFRIVVEDRPRVLAGHLNLAQAHVMNKQPDLALDVLEKAHANNPEAAVLLTAMAKIHVLKKDMDAAETKLKAAVDTDLGNLRTVMDLGDFYLASKKYEKALEQYQVIIAKKPDLANGYLKAASVYMAQNDDTKALAELKTGYEKNHNSASILAGLIKLHIKNKDISSAISLCNERLEKNKNEAFVWSLLGSVYLSGKNLAKAQAAFEKAMEIKPDWGVPYDNLARIYFARGEKANAIEKFQAALEKNPNNTAAWMILGNIYEKDKAYKKAAATYEQAFEKNPMMWVAANNCAYITSEISTSESELQKAMAMARKAERLKPDAGVVLDTLGWLHYKLGNTDLAYANIKKAVEEHPDNNVLNYHMGMVLDKQGKEAEAKIYLEKSLVSDRDFLGSQTAAQLIEKYNTRN